MNLDELVTEVFKIIKPTTADDNARKTAFNHIVQVIKKTKKIDEMPELRIIPYGSSESELHTKTSDIDVSIHVTQPSPDLLQNVAEACIKDEDTCKEVKVHPEGRVPVVKLTIKAPYEINCDITINNDMGVFSTVILKEIAKKRPQIKDLVLLVKRWCTAADLCDRHATLPCYPLSEFANLKITDSHPEEVIRAAIGEYFGREEEPTGEGAGKLFFEFITMFQDLEKKSKDAYISTFEGKWTNYVKKQNQHTILLIEDPFERMRGGPLKSPFARIKDRRPENILLNTDHRHLKRISDAFKNTYKEIIGKNKRTSILHKMMGPNVEKRRAQTGFNIRATLDPATKKILKQAPKLL
ncbi:protein HESO1 [Artemisia annua]|uniref:Protein HESO1 n=1 Tax=Artemisia annua TaxID=35608 RepID=A0A2U1LZ30_ARTAN|nr:protein HESO1 [Artemisia annua]